jgi:NADH:ubiquinone oxidoreductase subunit C
MNQESTREAMVGKIKSQFPNFVKETIIDKKLRIIVTFDKDHLLEIAKWMLDELELDHLKGIGGVDYPTHKKLETLYFLGSFSKPDTQDILVIMKTELPRDNPSIASVVSVWQSAYFHERETFEMFGITFVGHPDLRKLLTLDNWEGPPPLLKDIKFPEMGQR